MYLENLYHGSNRSRGEEVISDQKMKITRGIKHWLGDGSYLFIEDFQSYKWIVDMFCSRYKGETLNYSNLISKYLILECMIETNKVRIFDLTKSEHKILFDRVRKEMVKKNRIKTPQVAEGVTLNYMFNELGFDDDFDLVRAVFCLNRSNYKDYQSNLAYIPQEQICIKNLEVVKAIKEHDFEDKVVHFDDLLKDYYYSDSEPKSVSSNRKSFNNKTEGMYVNKSYKRPKYKKRQVN